MASAISIPMTVLYASVTWLVMMTFVNCDVGIRSIPAAYIGGIIRIADAPAAGMPFLHPDALKYITLGVIIHTLLTRAIYTIMFQLSC